MNANAPKNCIVLYTPTADGGHALYTWELATALAEAGKGRYRVEVVSSEDLSQQFRNTNYVVNAILPRHRPRSDYKTMASWIAGRLQHHRRASQCFQDFLASRPDIIAVHLQEWAPWSAARDVRRMQSLGKKVVHTVHNIVPHKKRPFVPKALMMRWVHAAQRVCDGLFVHTDQLRQELSEQMKGDHPAICVTPHGIWTATENKTRLSVAERFECKRLLFFGTIRPNKGLDLLLKAMPQLAGYRLTIAGEPTERDYYNNTIVPLIQQARERGAQIELADRFIPDEEASTLFATHSAMVMPYTSQFVAQSGVVFLALAHRMPVVAAAVGGLRDLMKEFRIGTTYSEQQPENLADAVRALFASPPDVIEQQIEAARESNSWRKSALATLRGYETVLQHNTNEYAELSQNILPA